MSLHDVASNMCQAIPHAVHSARRGEVDAVESSTMALVALSWYSLQGRQFTLRANRKSSVSYVTHRRLQLEFDQCTDRNVGGSSGGGGGGCSGGGGGGSGGGVGHSTGAQITPSCLVETEHEREQHPSVAYIGLGREEYGLHGGGGQRQGLLLRRSGTNV